MRSDGRPRVRRSGTSRFGRPPGLPQLPIWGRSGRIRHRPAGSRPGSSSSTNSASNRQRRPTMPVALVTTVTPPRPDRRTSDRSLHIDASADRLCARRPARSHARSGIPPSGVLWDARLSTEWAHAPLRVHRGPGVAGRTLAGSARGQNLVPTRVPLMEFLRICRRFLVASVVRRRRKDGSSSWYARYRDGAGKDRWEKCTSAKDARARAAEAAVRLSRTGGSWTPPARVTVECAALVGRAGPIAEAGDARRLPPDLRAGPAARVRDDQDRRADPLADQGVHGQAGERRRIPRTRFAT